VVCNDPSIKIENLGQDGVVVVKTAKTLLIGVYGQGQTHGRAVNVVEKLADYLQSSGF